jgi:hypothetical protein
MEFGLQLKITIHYLALLIKSQKKKISTSTSFSGMSYEIYQHLLYTYIIS